MTPEELAALSIRSIDSIYWFFGEKEMTRLERMADDFWAKNQNAGDKMIYSESEFFMAGFRAAREEIVMRLIWDLAHAWSHTALVKIIKDLGEEPAERSADNEN